MVVDVLLSVFGGGATGLFGTFAGKFFEAYEKKKEREFILHKYKLDMEIRAMETESEERIQEGKTSQEMVKDSYQHDMSFMNVSQWVNNIRALVRPTLTMALALTVLILWFSLGLKETSMNDAEQLRTNIVNGVLYCFTTALTWWFGDRKKR